MIIIVKWRQLQLDMACLKRNVEESIMQETDLQQKNFPRLADVDLCNYLGQLFAVLSITSRISIAQRPYDAFDQRRPRSACAFAWSDKGPRCSLVVGLRSTRYVTATSID